MELNTFILQSQLADRGFEHNLTAVEDEGVCGTRRNGGEGGDRIVGGKQTKPHEYPYQVASCYLM